METLEYVILETGEQLDQIIYEKNIAGELSQEELETVYNCLRQWSEISQRLLRLLTSRDGNFFTP